MHPYLSIENLGVTCVMVTHDQEEAMTMAHRIAVMDSGKLRKIGTPRRARQRKAVEAVEILVEETSQRIFVAGQQARHESAVVLSHRHEVRQAGGRRSIGD